MAGPFVVARNGVVIDAPAQRVFDYLADMTLHGEWNPEPDFQVTGQSRCSTRRGYGMAAGKERGNAGATDYSWRHER